MNPALVTVWFDGACPLCLREIALMRRLDKRGAIAAWRGGIRGHVARHSATAPAW